MWDISAQYMAKDISQVLNEVESIEIWRWRLKSFSVYDDDDSSSLLHQTLKSGEELDIYVGAFLREYCTFCVSRTDHYSCL